MNYKFLGLFACLICFSSPNLAQEPEIEELLDQQQEYSDISDLLEMLAELEKNPIDLNQATAEQLAVLPWVSNVIAMAIENYRQQVGGFKNIEELTQIKNLNPELIPILRKYITVLPKNIESNFSFATKTRLSRKFKEHEDFVNDTYYPSPIKVYNRFDLNYSNNFRVGLLLEKDSGERRLDDLRLYFLSYRDKSNRSILIIGNYRLEFAQGLVFGNPYGYHKGGDPIYPAKIHGRHILEYTLVDENASLHGISVQSCFKIYQFFLFLSSNRRDASLSDNGTVKNLYTSGYHRNAFEMDKKDRLNERLVGSRILIKLATNCTLGTTYYQSFFNRSSIIQDQNLNRFSFKGKTNELIGIDYNVTSGQFNLFGELARSRNDGVGFLTGILMETQVLQFIILGRNYSKNFISLYGSSFSERNDNPQNEQGIYFGFRFKPIKNLNLGMYFDQFKFPWRTYFIPMPSSGRDFLLRVEHSVIKNLSLSLQFKFEKKEQYVSEINKILPRNQNKLRMQLEFQPLTILKLRCRLEKSWTTYSFYKQFHSCYPYHFEGTLLYQDASLQLNHNFNIAVRLTFFDTDSYESRIYQFEHDVPGMLTNQMLYGIGTRSYITISWKIRKILHVSIKLGSTQYQYVDPSASDGDISSGSTSNSINLQLETNL